LTLLRTYSIIDIVRRQGLTNIGKAVHMKEMGMTDRQFNGFIRFLIDDLKEVREEKDEEKKNKRIEKILENLQSTLED